MKIFYIMLIIIIIAILLCGCVSQNSIHTNFEGLVKIQKEEMTDLYNEYIDVLNNIKDILYKEKNVRDISSDGYFIFEDGSKKWVDDISPRIKSIYSIDAKGYQTIGLHGGSDDKGWIFLYIETYYDKTRMSYRIEYSKDDLTQKSNWYSPLGNNWFWWEAENT